MNKLSKCLKSLADPGRLRALGLVSEGGELCVCEVEQVLAVTTSTASRNLRELEAAGWLSSRRDGRWVYYRLSDLEAEWSSARQAVLAIMAKDEVCQRDVERYKDYVRGRGLEACSSEINVRPKVRP